MLHTLVLLTNQCLSGVVCYSWVHGRLGNCSLVFRESQTILILGKSDIGRDVQLTITAYVIGG